MATTANVLVPRRWLRLPGRSARLRLTLLYSGMFLALGTAVVVVIFLVASGSSALVSKAAPSPGFIAPALHDAVSQQHNADVDRVLAGAWVTLLVTAAVSAVLGWFVAGRVLRPLRQMADAARAISAGNLHHRIALSGPDDEFKQLGDTIDDLLARLEASFAAQRRFVANAAHELRTPLTVERTVLQVALADPNASTVSLRAACEELLAAGRGQEQLLDSLLTLATSERGLDRRDPLDLAVLAQQALGGTRAEIEQRELVLRADLVAATVEGDPYLVMRLIANLVDNAVRYNRPGGWIDVETRIESDLVVLSVANSGQPVSRAQVERLFEPFQRLGRDRVGSSDHRGLGLSIVSAIATAHDAMVSAEPGREGGLEVSVVFPAASDAPPTGAPRSRPRSH